MSPQTLAAATVGVGMAGSLFAGLGQRAAGQQEQAGFDYNAEIDLLNMDNQMVANQQRYTQLVGKQATAYAASGVDITRGSPLLMMAATQGRGGRQAEEIYQAGTEQSTLDKYYGKIAAWRGTVGGIGTFLGGISRSAIGYLNATGYMPKDKSNPSGSGSDINSGDWINWRGIEDITGRG